jgi:hypothetical protein
VGRRTAVAPPFTVSPRSLPGRYAPAAKPPCGRPGRGSGLLGGTSTSFFLYGPEVDARWQRAGGASPAVLDCGRRCAAGRGLDPGRPLSPDRAGWSDVAARRDRAIRPGARGAVPARPRDRPCPTLPARATALGGNNEMRHGHMTPSAHTQPPPSIDEVRCQSPGRCTGASAGAILREKQRTRSFAEVLGELQTLHHRLDSDRRLSSVTRTCGPPSRRPLCFWEAIWAHDWRAQMRWGERRLGNAIRQTNSSAA